MPKKHSISEEYEIPYAEEDYEVVPVTPLRRLEKRLEALESSRAMANIERILDKLIDMAELNQRIIEEVVRSNQGLREELEVLIGKLNNLEEKLETFVDVLKELGEEELHGTSINLEEAMEPVVKKFEDVARTINESNKSILQALVSIDRRLKKLATESINPQPLPTQRAQPPLPETSTPPTSPQFLPPLPNQLEKKGVR